MVFPDSHILRLNVLEAVDIGDLFWFHRGVFRAEGFVRTKNISQTSLPPGFCRTKILNYTQTSETNGKRKDCSETDLYKHNIYICISVKIYIILIVLFYHNIITTCFVPHWIKHDTSNPVFSLFSAQHGQATSSLCSSTAREAELADMHPGKWLINIRYTSVILKV